MTPFALRRTAAAGLLAIATAGAMLGVASAQQTPTAPSVEQVAQQQPQPPQPPDGPGRPPGPPRLTDEQRQEMEQRRKEAETRYVEALAKNLNMDSATVRAALEQTQKDMQAHRIEEIKQAVKDGKLTQEQADQIIERIQNAPPGLLFGPGPGFPPGPPPPGGPGGPRGPRPPGGGPGTNP